MTVRLNGFRAASRNRVCAMTALAAAVFFVAGTSAAQVAAVPAASAAAGDAASVAADASSSATDASAVTGASGSARDTSTTAGASSTARARRSAAASAATGTSAAAKAPATPIPASEQAVSAMGLPAAQYTIRPGQSLNDIAMDITQSHDRATLTRAARALFDANPNAFMGHDPSRLKLGSVLDVPTLDASGAPSGPSAASDAAASAASGASGASGASAADSGAAVSASTPAAAAATSQSASAADATQTDTTSDTQQDEHASGAHVWAGAIRPSASAPEGGSVGSTATDTASTDSAASQPHEQVSSLQQLLALKNRVLMALQKHGIGSSTGAAGSGNVAQAPGAQQSTAGQAAGSGSVAANAPTGSGTSTPSATDGQFGFSQAQLSIAAAIGAALVVLLTGLSMRRRKAAKARAALPATAPVRPPTQLEKDTAAYLARMNALSEASAESVAPEAGAAASHVADAASDGISANAQPASLDSATTPASLTAAAEPGAEALPLAPVQPAAADHGDHAAAAELPAASTAEQPAASDAGIRPAPVALPFPPEAIAALGSLDLSLPPRTGATPAPATHDGIEPQQPAATFEPTSNEPAAYDAPHAYVPIAPAPVEQQNVQHESNEATGHDTPHAYVPIEPAPFAQQNTQHEPTTGHEAAQPTEPTEPTPVAANITAGTAGAASVAGLGAAHFGALNLDFDLELPPSPAQPVPAFTPDELARIARNKLDLAREYIQLGDLTGARTLINEVIEANDAGTHAEAHALLSTLAPLS
ncbi:FimV/HubP family polar landmark protein [Paraburkholderia acidicola]